MSQLFAGEYVTVSFPEVCTVLNDAVQRVTSAAGTDTVRARDRVRRVSDRVASLAVEWCDDASPTGWWHGDVRVLQVQSGSSPRTELMLAAPATVPAPAARRFLESLATAVQDRARLATAVG